jgi:hypothetical protein
VNKEMTGSIDLSYPRYFYLLTSILECPKCGRRNTLEKFLIQAGEGGKCLRCYRCKNKFIMIVESDFPFIFTALVPKGKDITKDQITSCKEYFHGIKGMILGKNIA